MPNTGTGRSEMDKEALEKARLTLRTAKEELAHERRQLQFRQSTTVDDALPFADTARVDAWLAVQLADMTLPTLLCEVLTEHLTADELARYERDFRKHPGVVDYLNGKAIERATAAYLADEADAYLDADEPSDEDRYAVYGRTPYDSDREALARSQNAAVRLEQML